MLLFFSSHIAQFAIYISALNVFFFCNIFSWECVLFNLNFVKKVELNH